MRVNICKIFVLLLVLNFYMPAFAYIVTTQTPYYGTNGNRYYSQYRPVYNNYQTQNERIYCKYFTENNIGALEKYAFHKSYRRENPILRLERLENLAFGAVQSGDVSTRYKNVEAAILSKPQNNYRRSLWGNMANYFNGSLTGFTPSINGDWDSNYNRPFYPDYGNTRVNQYSNGMFGGGYGIYNNTFGNGSTIRILE